MRSCGIVVEYNPFHYGHLYHLEQSKLKTKADILIAVMSGNFLQRGEPALVDKFTRTKMALKAGVDIVVELPYSFATQKAEVFATGAVNILSALNCNHLCFGSEIGEIDYFSNTIEFIETRKLEYNQWVQYYMKAGVSYPKASSLAFEKLSPANNVIDLSKPNNILGFHYVKAIIESNSCMQPHTIKRKNADYHDEEFTDSPIASATSIRKALFTEKSLAPIQAFVPESTYEELLQFEKRFTEFQSWENYWPFLKFRLLQTDRVELQTIYEVEEGIESRLLTFAKTSNSYKQFMENVKTKRYTWTRLQRMCTHILTNTTKRKMKNACQAPKYIRILGISKNGRAYLKQKKEAITLPVISTLSKANQNDIDLDIKASYTYAFGFDSETRDHFIKQEYNQPPIMI